ncbi:hypothetical protein L1049_017828 [Liquidambar formosana]|uniref:Uncharacterized protein n=1 Tax=Liquidambar formosana TaxID=63359 RepID=A0AAP0NJE1_LIQFO
MNLKVSEICRRVMAVDITMSKCSSYNPHFSNFFFFFFLLLGTETRTIKYFYGPPPHRTDGKADGMNRVAVIFKPIGKYQFSCFIFLAYTIGNNIHFEIYSH